MVSYEYDMMVLKTGSSTTTASSSTGAAASPESSSSTTSDKGASRQMLSKNAALRRRRSKGSTKNNDNDAAAQTPQSQQSSNSSNTNSIIDATNKQSHGRPDPPDPSSVNVSPFISSSLSQQQQQQQNQQLSSSSQSSQQQSQQQTSSTTAAHTNNDANKPCHTARLALLSCQNAVRMGSRTQLGLCPPGRIRKELKAALRQKNARTSRNNSSLMTSSLNRRSSGGLVPVTDMGGYFGVDKLMGPDVLEVYARQEDEFLNSGNGPSTPKNSSSFKVYDDESDEEASSGDDDDLSDMKELLLIDEAVVRPGDDEKKYATLMEPLFTPLGAEANAAAGPMQVGGMGVGKLPFNRRKLRYFDSVTARDTTIARGYLQQEIQRSKQREVLMLAQHLKQTQRLRRREIKEQRGQPLDSKDLDEAESAEELSRIPSSVGKLEETMTPSVAAALVIESLEMNPLESIEGMAKCYEGIVAAGVALLEAGVTESAMSPSKDTAPHATRSEIMAALTPLLITSLEQPSGDVILLLAKLRRMCGTARYQRRFVQRIAPSLIRPPRGAMWCLRHQNDMEPILAAAELIFDSAFDVFSKGWYDRGQLLLADSKRAETLSAAAMQLKNLSSNPHEGLTLDLGHSGWRSNKYKSGKDAAKGAKEPLAEWEVIAVDRQIRVSISNIISMDWSKVVVHSREAALSTTSYHRSRQPSRRPSALLQATSSGDMSPNNASPARQLTPRNQQPPSADSEGSHHSSSLPHLDLPRERSRSPVPPPTATVPLSPPPPSRRTEEISQSGANLFPSGEQTPPRSPSDKKEFVDFAPSSSIASSPASPKRGNGRPTGISTTPQVKESISNVPETVAAATSTPQSGGDSDRAPLSPLSVGTATPVESVSQRPMSSASSVGSSVTGLTGFTGVTGAQPSNYRMLTSTAAERKRTVAACRALRAQITRFEEAFIQLHGRPPKGATERAPLATTYAQYREWKRAIRADAACRIQALFRGASTRWKLLRSNDPRASRVVMSRAGRRSTTQQLAASQPSGQDPALKDISIDIGENRADGALPSGVIRDRYGSQGQATSQSRSPSWAVQGGRRQRSGSGGEDFASNPSIPRPTSSPSANVKSAAELSNLSLSELQGRKRDLKQQLKQYDMDFARRHGRMPVKAEKEPIRHLYEKYNALKSQITMMEQEGRGVSSPMSTPQTSSAAMLAQRTISPVGSDSEESGPRVRTHSRGNRTPSLSTGQTTSQDLAALKAEKGRLHQMLRSYEKDFYREHQRQVSSFADIRPVASQYRRYKEIKKAIAALQSGEREKSER